MGLGGHLTWTAAIREIYHKNDFKSKGVKILPCTVDDRGNYTPLQSEIFYCNPYCYTEADTDIEDVFPLPLNLPETNYCKEDYPDRCVHRTDKHIIEQICEHYGIHDPELKCDLWFTHEEIDKVWDDNGLIKYLSDDIIVIEPVSKTNYTPNRSYPFDKWQTIVNALRGQFEIVQVGTDPQYALDGVTDFIGKTTFREAVCLIEYARGVISTEGGLIHAATAVKTPAVSIVTGYQDPRMVNYPQNCNINIGNHGPCGLKVSCPDCVEDAKTHNENEIVSAISEYIPKI